MNNFERLGLARPLLDAITALGYETPTPIQVQAIPPLLSKDTDLVGLAQTGTGKTAAFGLPLIQLIDPEFNKVQGLILAPTRELCLQITNELGQYSKFLPKLKITPVYGGADIRKQMMDVKKGTHIIVATPGRLRDLMRRGVVHLDTIRYFILDEADEMLNMGFKEEIDEILKDAPENKNTWLFSATMPPEVKKISRDYMVNPIEVSMDARGGRPGADPPGRRDHRGRTRGELRRERRGHRAHGAGRRGVPQGRRRRPGARVRRRDRRDAGARPRGWLADVLVGPAPVTARRG